MKTNISRSFLALAAALAVSMGSSHAQTLVNTDFSSATPLYSGLNPWDTSTTYGHLSFGAGGAVSTGGFYDTTATLSSTVTLSSSPTWVNLGMNVSSVTNAASTSFTSSLNFSDGSNITFGSKPSSGASPNWNTFYTAPSYAGVYGGNVTAPTGLANYLTEITTDGSTITVQAWAFDTPFATLPSSDPTGDATGAGAVNFGTFTFASTATTLTSVELGGQGLIGSYTSLVIADDYADILSPTPVPEPSTLGFLTAGVLALIGFSVRRRFCS